MALVLAFFSSCERNSDSIICSDKTSPPAFNKIPTSNSYIPLVVVLFENGTYGGSKRFFISDNPNLATTSRWSNKASAMKIYKGPDYNAFVSQYNREPTVTLYQHTGFGGVKKTFEKGKYPSLSYYNFNDMTNSLEFNKYSNGETTNNQPTTNFDSIHTVLNLYEHNNYKGYWIVILGTTMSEFDDLSDFYPIFKKNDFASSYRAFPGPNAADGKGIELSTEKNYMGGSFDVYGYSEDEGNLASSYNDKFSSSESIN